ncbi:rhodanese-like domain-containing protein [Thiohalophilus sp.]|uniref:rhodanese-like domain-containing protein n=1 Tax=Thiohalophilus sp. TaxID=3028392 RepID=UPI002ACE1444|nr:rhodanese-like domain-containing protein [Thiohalophilus sp.]MDZ7661173.1 rhodanese-like domain-containing protein [Thiohalophilus sp.]
MKDIKVEELRPQQAWQLLQDEPKAVLVDVRSHMEFLFIGHPVGAINIPWIDEPDWEVNPNFVRELRQLLLGGLSHDETVSQSVPVVLICRSGKRSLEAGKLLLQEEFDRVYNVSEGFEGELDEHHHRSSKGGWRFAGLPWEQC